MLRILLIVFISVSQVLASCDLEGPLQGDDGIGLILVPGAKISGQAYLPILRKIQEELNQPIWIAATAAWFGDMPNPVEIGGQVDACLELARSRGFDTSRVFFAGHSLGGIVMESYIGGNPDIAQGIVMLGTWLPDLVRGYNDFPVPVLTAIGELDGGGLSYLRREWEETEALSEEVKLLTKTILVPQVNHGQVASGEVPESVIENDIDAELSESDAHKNYAVRVADWLNLVTPASDEELQTSLANYIVYEAETFEFLQPFFAMHRAEQDGMYSPFSQDCQTFLLENDVPNPITVGNEILNGFNFHTYSPNIEKREDGSIHIGTYTFYWYDLDALDFNNHLSAGTMKTKFKSADSIYQLANMPTTGKFKQCGDLNKISYNLALSMASRDAIQRMNKKGRTLVFGPDVASNWIGVPWEDSGYLTWTEENIAPNGQVTLTSTHLESDTGFPLYGGMHYCDILSPYRALEWIYIESVRNTMQFV